MHDLYTPLGGLIPLLNIQLGEVIFGGVGGAVRNVGLCGARRISRRPHGGRTPEYVGKKIESYDVKAAVLFVMVPVLGILGFTAWAVVSSWGLTSLNNAAGPRLQRVMLYAFSSATGNNGSAFAGLNTNTPWYDTTMGNAMLLGRFS